MTFKKTAQIGSKKNKVNSSDMLKTCSPFVLIMIVVFFTTPIRAQNNKDTTTSAN
jgi:hypothetical protein